MMWAKFSHTALLKALLLAFLVGAVVVASGSPLQVFLSRSFWCGRSGSGQELHVLMVIAATQLGLYLLGQYSERVSKLYSATQWLGIFVCLPQVIMLGQAYPGTFSFIGLAIAMSFGLALIILRYGRPAVLQEFSSQRMWERLPYLVSLAVLLTLTWLVVSGLVAQYFLYRPAQPLTMQPLLFCLTAGAVVAVAGVWSFHDRNGASYIKLSLPAFPPFFILLLALLRAKYPDVAFDTFLYKGVWPYLIADWRTAGMAALDHVGIGSNFHRVDADFDWGFQPVAHFDGVRRDPICVDAVLHQPVRSAVWVAQIGAGIGNCNHLLPH
jgi:hypothetical protein